MALGEDFTAEAASSDSVYDEEWYVNTNVEDLNSKEEVEAYIDHTERQIDMIKEDLNQTDDPEQREDKIEELKSIEAELDECNEKLKNFEN